MLNTVLLTLICIGASHSLKFDCIFNNKTLPILEDIYFCEPTVSAGENSRIIESVSGTHKDGKNNDDVKRLTIDNQNLPTLPYNLGNIFPKLLSIRVYNSSLQTLTSLDFQPFPDMIVIDFGYNLLTTLESDLFKYTPNLEWISFFRNELTTIGHNSLSGLENLEYLNFSYNKCTNRYSVTKSDVAAVISDVSISCLDNSGSCQSSCRRREKSEKVKKLSCVNAKKYKK